MCYNFKKITEEKNMITKRSFYIISILIAVMIGSLLMTVVLATTIGTVITTTTLTANTSVTTPTLTSSAGLVVKPGSDSTAAVSIQKSDGTSFVNFDSTNSRMSLGTATAPTEVLDVAGNIKTNSCNKFNAWSRINTLTTDHYSGIGFVDANTGFTTRNLVTAPFTGFIYKSTDGGNTWTVGTTTLPNTPYNSLTVTGGSTIIAVGTDGTITRSTNTGSSWSTTYPLGTTTALRGIAFNGANGVAVGTGPTLGRSSDSGGSWTSVSLSGITTSSLWDVEYVGNSSTLVAVSDAGGVIRSTNNGTSWSAVATTGTSNDLYGVGCASTSICVAGGFSGTLIRTTNGGTSWSTVTSGINQNINEVLFLNSTTGLLMADAGILMRTTDAGATWQRVHSDSSNLLQDAALLPSTAPGTVIVIGDNATMRKSTDLGIGGSTLNTGGCLDIAELYPVADENLLPGMLVSIAQKDELAVKRSRKPYEENLLGVVSSDPAILIEGGSVIMGGPKTKEKDKIPLALAGRVPVKVSNENGRIDIGDPITASSIPGIGMKATKPGKIVGFALEAFTAKNGEILMSVNPQMYVPLDEWKQIRRKLESLEKKLLNTPSL